MQKIPKLQIADYAAFGLQLFFVIGAGFKANLFLTQSQFGLMLPLILGLAAHIYFLFVVKKPGINATVALIATGIVVIYGVVAYWLFNWGRTGEASIGIALMLIAVPTLHALTTLFSFWILNRFVFKVAVQKVQ